MGPASVRIGGGGRKPVTAQENYWTVPREWAGETCFIIGGGPSLHQFDAAVLRGRRVIVINRSFRMAPWADVLYFCDGYWWTGVDGPEAREKFEGKYIVTIAHGIKDPIVKRLENTSKHELATDPSQLGHGTNSGFQAINLAYHFGAMRIVLLGFDMKIGAQTHHHGGYGAPPEIVSHVLKTSMLPHFAKLVEPLEAAGVEVINANPDSALDCWPRLPLEFILDGRRL